MPSWPRLRRTRRGPTTRPRPGDPRSHGGGEGGAPGGRWGGHPERHAGSLRGIAVWKGKLVFSVAIPSTLTSKLQLIVLAKLVLERAAALA